MSCVLGICLATKCPKVQKYRGVKKCRGRSVAQSAGSLLEGLYQLRDFPPVLISLCTNLVGAFQKG